MTHLDIEGSKGGSQSGAASSVPTGGKHYVFGRREYPEPLEHVMTVSGDELKALGREGEAWVELVAFPEAAVIHVIGDKSAGVETK